MTMRLPPDEQRYQAAETRSLLDIPAKHDYDNWRIVPNDYPHTRISEANDMLILKRKASIDQLSNDELEELMYILSWLASEYDTVALNLASMASVKDIPHFHLYKLKEEYK